MNTENNRKLSDEELNQVAGGAGDAMGKWLIGDCFTVKTVESYIFGVLQNIVTFNNGETRYIIDMKFEASLKNRRVSESNGSKSVDPDRPASGVIIKKIYDFPAPGYYGDLEADLAKWIR